MSDLIRATLLPELHQQPCNGVERIIQPRQQDLGGFSVRRVLPTSRQAMIGPWIFFDHMGPAEFQPGSGIDVRPHPHINLATVTYLFEGEIWHRDSLGSDEAIKPGDVNLMIAGSGIVHSERSGTELRARGHKLHGLQLWLALPASAEEITPAFHHYDAAEIPQTELDGVPVRVIMGAACGLTSPVKTLSPTLYLEAHMQPGQHLDLPNSVAERGLYVAQGELQANNTALPEYSMTVFSPGRDIRVTATRESRIALIGGDNIGERHIWWNFISSRAERIEQAKTDWQQGRFPRVPGDSEEFIPLPE